MFPFLYALNVHKDKEKVSGYYTTNINMKAYIPVIIVTDGLNLKKTI